jgi:hypothetical protein
MRKRFLYKSSMKRVKHNGEHFINYTILGECYEFEFRYIVTLFYLVTGLLMNEVSEQKYLSRE